MPYADQSPDPIRRLAAKVKRLEDRIAALERREFVPPILDADPTDPLPGQMWVFNDGRLRVHNADGETFTYHPGSYLPTLSSHPASSSRTRAWLRPDTHDLHVRFADGSLGRFDNTLDVGGGASGDPDSGTDSDPAPNQPKSHQHRSTWSANATGCYCPAHGRESRLYFGTFPGGSHPERRVMYGLPHGAISSTLSGSVIRKVEIRVRTLHAWDDSGVDVRWGMHNAATLGPNFGQRYNSVFTRHWPKSGYPTKSGWITVPNFVGEALRDGKARGLTIDQPSTSQSFYGQMAKDLDIRVTFTHSH